MRRIVEGTLKREKMLFLICLRQRYEIPEFFTIAPVLTSTLTICRRIAAIRRLYIGLRVRFTSIKNIVVLVWPGAAHMPIAVYVGTQVYSVQQ